MARTGIWIIGARGGLATTLIAGTHLVGMGKAPTTGLVTESSSWSKVSLFAISDVVFGGHDVRTGSVHESALEISRTNHSIPLELLPQIAPLLDAADANIRLGTAYCGGPAIESFAVPATRRNETSRTAIARLRSDLREFKERERLSRVVVVNLASTEPPPDADVPTDRSSLEKCLRTRKGIRASTLYAVAAIEEGMPYVNFTPSTAALNSGLIALALHHGVPVAGSDGKTGETLVKSALAPMFAHRALSVLSWQGYNILGDRDGQVLADPRHKASKVKSKDAVLKSILGYAPHTHVGIDYVPSLGDMKTAWDFIHFSGFLGHRMSMQFVWQGCDAILAAPLVLDLCRIVARAADMGVAGAIGDLGFFFKSPAGESEHDLHVQWQRLDALAARLSKQVAKRRK